MTRTRSLAVPFSTLCLVGALALLAVKGTLPAARARADSRAKQTRLLERRAALHEEIAQLRAESEALSTDYQYNRRLERIFFRDGPQPGD